MSQVPQVSHEERRRRATAARAASNRRSDRGHPTTAEIDYSRDDLEFMDAIQVWKAKMGRQFPTWQEVLGVVRGLGYAKPFEPPQGSIRIAQETTRPAEDETPWRAA